MAQPERRSALAMMAGVFCGLAAPNGRAAPDDRPLDWTHAAPLLRPKLLPAYFEDAYPALIKRPFSVKLVIACAIDRGRTDEYVEEQVLADWQVTADAMHGRALSNLEEMSRELPTAGTAQRADGDALFIAKGDGYDAARLLLPGLRGRLLALLGPQAFAAVPARDFLMLWSVNDPKRHDLVGRVVKENAERPYSLSTEIFMVSADAVRVASADETAR